ncbi:MAG TPA: hypothetical protein VGE23_01005 [Candidatus Paceibacterota bacterium]
MCRGSVRARTVEPARAGERYQIGQSYYGAGDERSHRQGVLHRPGQGKVPGDEHIVACAACIRTETPVTLEGVPPTLQRTLGVGGSFSATFVPGADTARESQDQIRLDDGRQFKLWEFADHGIELSLVLAERESRPVQPARATTTVRHREPAMA